MQGEVSQLAAFSLATKPVTIVAVLKSATESFWIVVSPARLASLLDEGDTETLPLDIENVGTGDLDWTVGEAAQPLAPGAHRAPQAVLYDNGPIVTHPGGGFGGATINMVTHHEADKFIAHMVAGYEKKLGVKTKPLVCQVVDGGN